MARMIPSTITSDCKSPGEIEIFRRLKNDPATQDWTVLHSLDLAHHETKISGEVDFVIIIPQKGVLCLEVKACSSLKRENGQWYYGSDLKPDPRGPFKQAAEAMHSIRKRIVSRRPDFSDIVFWSGVIFPYIEFSQHSEEWHPWQVIDRGSFHSKPLGQLIGWVMDNARTFLKTRPSAKWFKPYLDVPTAVHSEAISNLLRPDFEMYESPKSRQLRLSKELKQYTEEQFLALDVMEENSRVVFKGPAGTGKTLLAIESARRAAAEGKKVLFLCFNRFLGNWLKDQTAASPQITAKTLHRHMLDMSGLHPLDIPDFWQNILPCAAVEKLLTSQDEAVFDVLIIDELQDILRESYLDFLDVCLKGGLASGIWRFFGDFEKQVIYGKDGLSIHELLRERAGDAPVYNLRTNCRNTPRIAEHARLLGGLSPGYTRILRQDDGVEPEIKYYKEEEEGSKLLASILDALYKGGYTGEDIVLLSTREDSSCAALKVNSSPWKERIVPFEKRTRGYIGYSSIHAFKGMESPAVVVTDVNRLSGEDSRSLFYVAVTRALSRLVILASEQVKNDIVNLIVGEKPVMKGGT